jgi:hypothetical protein
MSEDELDRDVLSRVGIDRREFVKRLMLGSAFAVPVVASFDMGTLSAEAKRRRSSLFANGALHHLPHYFPYGDLHHGDNPSWR